MPDLCLVTVAQTAAFQHYINLHLKVLAGFINSRMLESGFMSCMHTYKCFSHTESMTEIKCIADMWILQ